ncbi:hypothetical protein [Microbacterium dauci]|uniref:Uncharacterized protein n=1 Tax=Microbacterium dauci TaxID=3048008 RepID=A0ABT6ZEU7_9MICO|nr:hypothetical protein [Microbacterium sp. LX3-4]MDJ1114680.1 hypothetical protein [Microbacterium sp. LX3-4]
MDEREHAPQTDDEKERADAPDRGNLVDDPPTDQDEASDAFVASAEIQQELDPDVLTDES